MSVEINNKIVFEDPTDLTSGRKQTRLKSKLGQGIYISDVEETAEDNLLISFGNTVPKDVSDSRENDRVLQFIDVDDIHKTIAKRTNGSYVLELPTRDELHQGYIQRRTEILNHLDYTTARIIYENIFHFSSVDNQMTPIIEIVKWVQLDGSMSISEIEHEQNSDNTRLYVETLSDLSFLEVSEDRVSPGEKMQSIDLDPSQKSREEYTKALIGQVIKDGYFVLRDKLDMNMLDHYPQFSNAYYYPALQRNDPNLELDIDRIRSNYQSQYNKECGRRKIRDKMDQLSRAGVVKKDGEYIGADPEVFEQLSSQPVRA